MARLIESQKCEQAIVFVDEPAVQSHLFHYLNAHGLPAVTLNPERTKSQRERALTAFRRGEARVLLVTDALARGLDVPDVGWVLHHSMPRGPEAYVHRAGRTGRAGRSGRSVVLVQDREAQELRRLEGALGITFVPLERG